MERELLLLGLLRRGDMHGYRLNEYVSGVLANCVDLKKATAYFLLDKMAERGWISVSEERAGNRPLRKVYRITVQGEAAFQSLLRENLASFQLPPFVNDLGLAFMDALEPHEAEAHLIRRRTQLTTAIELTSQIPQHAGSLQLMIEHRAAHLAAELDWLDRVIARLQHNSTESVTE